MKTTKIKFTKKAMTKAVSAVLSLVMTANIGLNLLTSDAFAANYVYPETDADGYLDVNGGVIEITAEATGNDRVFYLEYVDGNYVITKTKGNYDDALNIGSNSFGFTYLKNVTLYVCADYDFAPIKIDGTDASKPGKLIIADGASAELVYEIIMDGYTEITNNGELLINDTTTITGNCTINNNNTMHWHGSLWNGSGNHTFTNKGTLEIWDIYLPDWADNGFTKFHNGPNGDIISTNVDITGGIYSDESGSEIHFDYYLDKDDQNLNAIVYSDRSGYIRSAGGTFTLRMDEGETVVSGVIDASSIDYFDDPNVTLDAIPDVYVGQTIDYSSYIHTAAGYPGTAYVEFSSDWGSTYTTDEPTTSGEYRVRAVAPGKGSYGTTITADRSVKFGYLDKSEVDSNGNYYSFGNVVDVGGQDYVDEEVKVVPASGFQISCSHASDTGFADYVMLSEDQILSAGNVNAQAFFRFKRISDGAETAEIYATSVSSPSFEDLIFDNYSPSFEAYILDPETGEIVGETSVDYDGAEVTADSLTVRVYDDTLESVILDINGTTKDLSSTIGDEEGYCEISLNGIAGKKQVVTITATDAFGKESVAEFELYSDPVDPTLTLTLPDKIYAGSIWEPQVDTDSDSAITFLFKDLSNSQTLSEIPKEAGLYEVTVSVAATKVFNAASTTEQFEIVRRDLDVSVSVANITYGETVTPVITGVPDNYTEAVTYEYKLSSDEDSEYSEVIPENAGTYSVRATLPGNDLYKGTTCTNTFKINKKAFTVSVRVADITIGETITPALSALPEDYNGGVSYEYKLSTDTEFTNEVPTAAGTYTIRATLAATANYESTTCTATFKINKKTAEASVTVEDIVFLEIPDPVVTTESDGKDKATFEYKLSTAAETAYSDTVPRDAGTYDVRATIPETDTYLSTTCTTTFTISRKDVSATVTVADIYVGGTPIPKVRTQSDGTITYEYKEAGALDSSYSSDIPTAAGTYTVRATIAATANFESTYCTADFNVKKITLTADIVVNNIVYGETVSPYVVPSADDYEVDEEAIVFEYKLSSDLDSAYTDDKPTEAGTYTVRATLPETDKYLGATSEKSFSINPRQPEASVTISDITLGDIPSPEVTTDSTGEQIIEYRLNTSDTYSEDIPSVAGEYTVRVTIQATKNYTGTTCTAEFTVNKRPASAEVYVEDIIFGGTIKPIVTTDSNGKDKTTYEYKLLTDSTYTTTVPTDAGTYSVRATIPETDEFLSTSCTSTFTIEKKEPEASVSVADIFVGGTPNPVVTSESDGKATYEYKISTADNKTYSSTVPTAAGTYSVRATIAETANYLSTTCEKTFNIKKNAATATVTVSDIVVGETPNPKVETISNGKVTIEYRLSSEKDFTEKVPTAAGTYDVRATIAESDKYLSTSCATTFTIAKKTPKASVTVANIYVGGVVKPVVTTESEVGDKAEFEYRLSSGSAFTSTVPSAAGTYTVRATIPETAEFGSTTCTCEFTISLNPVTVMELTVADIYVGQTVKPEYKVDSDGQVTIRYKEADSNDSYTTEKPTKPGRYIALATVAETNTYASDSRTAEFSISYLKAPATAFIPEGTSGNNGFFTSDVVLKAPTGYKISNKLGGEYKDSIPYTEGLETIYLRRNDGALTDGIKIADKPQIDKTAPSVKTTTGTLDNGTTMYASNLDITADDKNLDSITVKDSNGKTISGNGNITTLSPGYGVMTFTISAVDKAGNTTTVKVTLMSEWLQDRILPADVPLPLEVKENYALDDGTWTVNMTDSNGNVVEDTTVYNGNMQVYVNENADYTFTKVAN